MTTETPSDDERPGIAAAVVVRDGCVLLVRRRVREGELLWQFPAGEVEAGESEGEAAVREVGEETGVVVRVVRGLGGRVHPKTGRRMAYVACEVVSGEAYVADREELAEVVWCGVGEIPEYVPYGVYGPVQEYLDRVGAA
ncbi:NUDIX hydrolase [Streptomyces acidiscabies]|uniref:NUDIX hydrolase n=1 Tax=Streptomyces acidiscabies TaxID=42234 RepID=UPI0030CE4A1F